MNQRRARLSKRLQEIRPAISAINWVLYGEKITTNDESVVVSHFSIKPTKDNRTKVCKFVPIRDKAELAIVRKVRIIRESNNPNIISSLQLRDHKKRIYGGGIRSSFGLGYIYAIGGLPEIGNHLLATHLMWECAMLYRTDWELLNNPNLKKMVDARNDVGMTEKCFWNLNREIFEIVRNYETT